MAAAAGQADELFDEGFLRRLEYLHLVSRQVFVGRARAERRARRAGAGIEFADHRDYAPGDDLRYLDWGAYGRLGRMLVRLFEEEEDLHIYLLLDASASMDRGRPLKHDYARRVAAALAYVGLANLDRVALLPFGGGPREMLPPSRGRGQVFRVLDFLRGQPAQGATGLRAAAAALVHSAPRRGIAVVVSDFYDPEGPGPALDLLRYHRFEPLVIQVVAAQDARPPLEGDVEIVDCETGEARAITVTPSLAAAYEREHQAFCEELARFCAARGIPCVRTETDVPFDDLVLRVFREGGFLK